MAVTLIEIDSFTSKFKALLANGFQATLTLEAVEGEAFVTLRAGLGKKVWPTVAGTPVPKQDLIKRPRSPSYYRRQEKRKLDRQQIIMAEAEVADAEVAAAKNSADNYFEGSSNTENVVTKSGAEKALTTPEPLETIKSENESNRGSETFIYSHWSEKVVSLGDAVKQIEERLIQSFYENKIYKANQN